MKFKKFKIGVLVSAAAAVCGIILKRRQNTSDREKGSAKEGQDQASAIAEGIKRNARVFDGLYESLFQAARNQELFSTEAYEEWCDRAANLEDEAFRNGFAGAFSKSDIGDPVLCRKKYDSLLDYIAQADIHRERENGRCYPADEAMCMAYQVMDGTKPEAGAEYSVVKSAWISGKKVIEYGMVMRKEMGWNE